MKRTLAGSVAGLLVAGAVAAGVGTAQAAPSAVAGDADSLIAIVLELPDIATTIDLWVDLDGGSFSGTYDPETGSLTDGEIDHPHGDYPGEGLNTDTDEYEEITLGGSLVISGIDGTVGPDGAFSGTGSLVFDLAALTTPALELDLGSCPIPSNELSLTGAYDVESQSLTLTDAEFTFESMPTDDAELCAGLVSIINDALGNGVGEVDSVVSVELALPEETTTTAPAEETTTTTAASTTDPAPATPATPISGRADYTG